MVRPIGNARMKRALRMPFNKPICGENAFAVKKQLREGA